MTGTGILAGAIAMAICAALLWRRKRRKRTRALSDMDHDVHERIRRISAEARYSSAGIEF
jgi:hypothetical protein